eukprot:scaffold29095_cov30-Attheya_sp.AAC.2
MDANECLETGKLAKALTKLGMHDAIKTWTRILGPATFAYGQRQIDGISTVICRDWRSLNTYY